MTKKEKLKFIAQEIEVCTICRHRKVGKAVPGEGKPDADVLFVGEAPGRTESETGRPFVGRSGKFLRKKIFEIGLDEHEVFITSPVKYLPEYVTPTQADIGHGKTHFDKQVEIIDPKIIVLLGNVAATAILGKKLPILKEHGKIIDWNGRRVFATVHPAAAIRFARMRKIFNEDFEKLKGLIS